MFAKNVNYNRNENALQTVLAYSHDRNSQYDEKFENFGFSANNMNASGLNYVDVERKEFGAYKHQKNECDENFDSFMETDNENHTIRMT